MRTARKLGVVAAALLCLPFCGAWTDGNADANETVYGGAQLISTYSTETVYYTSKTVLQEKTTKNGVPKYYGSACGAVAGATAIGYYDRYYSNMIVGWDSYYSNGEYRMQDGTYVPALMNDLSGRMNINASGGVTESNFKSGFTSYINDHGYSTQFRTLGSGNGYNNLSFQAAVYNDEVAALFVHSSDLYYIGLGNNCDTITTSTISGNHIMIAYGFYEVQYATPQGTRVDKYLEVATGFSYMPTAYYKVNSQIESAYVLHVQ